MDRREWIATAVLIAVATSIAVSIWIALQRGVLTLASLEYLLLEAVLVGGAVSIAVLVANWGFRPRIRRWEDRRGLSEVVAGTARPQISVEILPHKKGHIIVPPVKGRVKDSPLLDPTSTKQFYSHPDRAEAQPSQVWDRLIIINRRMSEDTRWVDLRSSENVFWAKFGAIRIHVAGGTLHACRARCWFRTLKDPANESAVGQWIRTGDLDWATMDYKHQFLEENLRRLPKIKADASIGLNRFLGKNRVISIHVGHPEDLQLFYTLNEDSRVFATGGRVCRRIGTIIGTRAVKFQVKVVLTADNLEPAPVYVFECTARKDDFSTTRLE